MTEPAESRRGRPRDPDAGVRIREAAASLLLEGGIDGMTVDAVAERAGVGKATVYRRWSSKDELALTAVGALLGMEVRVPDTGTLLGDLTEVYVDLLRLAADGEGRAFFRLAAAEAGRDSRVGELYRISLADHLDKVTVIFDRAIARGELPPDVDRQLMFDWPTGVIIMRILTNVPVPGADEAAALAHATIHGFAGPAQSR